MSDVNSGRRSTMKLLAVLAALPATRCGGGGGSDPAPAPRRHLMRHQPPLLRHQHRRRPHRRLRHRRHRPACDTAVGRCRSHRRWPADRTGVLAGEVDRERRDRPADRRNATSALFQRYSNRPRAPDDLQRRYRGLRSRRHRHLLSWRGPPRRPATTRCTPMTCGPNCTCTRSRAASSRSASSSRSGLSSYRARTSPRSRNQPRSYISPTTTTASTTAIYDGDSRRDSN